MASKSISNLPPRLVHLLGGLHVLDDCSGRATIQTGPDAISGHFPAPPYPNLYATLRSLGLIPIGVEFVNDLSIRGLDAPDWECLWVPGGFRAKDERRAWGDVRTAALKDKNGPVIDLASRSITYVELLGIRILDLSIAYNQMLRAWRLTRGEPGHFFSNTFQRNIDAAVHAFVADAASYRDLIAEIVWRLVLNGQEKVTTLASFIKKAATASHPLAVSIIAAGKPGGWLKVFTDLRNEITHVAPAGRSQSLHFCEPREVALATSGSVVQLHYPLLEQGGEIRRVDYNSFDYDNDQAIQSAIESYKEYVGSSIDGLQYAWETFGKLLTLHGEAGAAANLRSEQRTLTKDDIIGEIRRVRY